MLNGSVKRRVINELLPWQRKRRLVIGVAPKLKDPNLRDWDHVVVMTYRVSRLACIALTYTF